MSEPAVDILIMTLNEASHISEAVDNARLLGTVYVLDSGSTDGTRELAEQAGAVVIEHAWEGYARQKNWALDNMPFKAQWIFILDADERITPRLKVEVIHTINCPRAADGYFVNRLMVIMGRPIRHGGLFPSWNLRLFRRGMARYEERSVHEHMICYGKTGYLRGRLLHIRSESMDQYVAKHIRYADLESDEWVKAKIGSSTSARPEQIFRDALRWRQWLRRRIWPHVPWRPTWRFLYMYFVRLGFLDGRAGWDLAMLMASYEYMITLLYKEKLEKVKNTPPEAMATLPARGARLE